MCRAWPLYFTQVWRKASHCLCDVGLWFDVDDYGDYVCKLCHAKFFKNHIANDQTAAGQVGQACPAGTYQDDVDKTSFRECADLNAFSSSIAADTPFDCTGCPSNSRIVASRATVLENSGFTGEDGGPCVDCSAGKYKNTIGS